MKRLGIIAMILLYYVIFSGCSTTPDNNGGTNTTIIPIAPSNLTGIVISNSRVNLSWTDNSTNETGFKIERRQDGGNYTLIGTVNPDIINYSDSALISSVNYTYRVYSYNAVGNSITYSNEFQIILNGIPNLTTIVATSITANSALSGGVVVNDGGLTISSRGVIWSTNPNPTIDLSTKTNDGNGLGSFNSNLTNLLPNTTYYLRAYATNSLGTGYGNEVNFSTPDFSSVTICSQTWMTRNLDVSRFRNGDEIPYLPGAWNDVSLTTPAWCYYNDDSTSGKLYNWYALTDSRGIAPLGWHIPNNSEWNNLTKCIDSNADTTLPIGSLGSTISNIAGSSLKEVGNNNWFLPNSDATNSTGFTALPFGANIFGFTNFGSAAYYWSTNETNNNGVFTNAYCVALTKDSGFLKILSYKKMRGFSVRCVKD